jgi:hypothetical protein
MGASRIARVAVLLGIAGGTLGAVASAGAATVTLGSPLTAAFTTTPAGSVGTTAMVSGPNITSPVDGTIVNWRLDGFNGGPLRLRVIQLAGGNAATSVATGPDIVPAGGITDQPLSVPIKKGQIFGFDNSSDSDTAKIAPSSTISSAGWIPPLVDNAPPQAPLFGGPGEFATNVTVRYCVVPNLKGKKLGAARTTLTGAGCALGSVKKKKGQKGAKFVRSQSVAAGTSLADQATVDVRLGKKKKKKK